MWWRHLDWVISRVFFNPSCMLIIATSMTIFRRRSCSSSKCSTSVSICLHQTNHVFHDEHSGVREDTTSSFWLYFSPDCHLSDVSSSSTSHLDNCPFSCSDFTLLRLSWSTAREKYSLSKPTGYSIVQFLLKYFVSPWRSYINGSFNLLSFPPLLADIICTTSCML